MVFPEKDLPAVAKAAHEVVQDAKDAGVFVFAGGVDYNAKQAVVATDGMVTDGICVVDVPTWEAALESAAKIAVELAGNTAETAYLTRRRDQLG
jgi:hypothetical protein